jgi:HlyD family secretion protein
MEKLRKPRRSNLLGRLAVTLALLAVSALSVFAWVRWSARRPAGERYELVGVHRADLLPILTASGRVESSKRTVIECTLERIGVGVQGRGIATSGAATLLTLVPEGTMVRQGDLLAVIDSSEYEELLRIQAMTVERSKADRIQAALDHEIAKMALIEFNEGTKLETTEEYQGKITLARSDLERAKDRRDWSHNMKDKGYASLSVVAGDEFHVEECQLDLEQLERAFDLFKRFTVTKTVTALEGSVKGAEAILEYQNLRTQRNTTRFQNLQKQVTACTIRAPHDGFVIYANDARRGIIIEPGISVRQRQALMYLPDMTKMEIVAQFHESTIDQVRSGQLATIEVESSPGVKLSGKVVSVSPLATFDWWTDVRYFEGIVRIEHPPADLRPGMTAQVEISMPRRENVLTIPSEAITSDDGLDVCFVVHDEGLERRPVKLGHVTQDMAEVTDGLREGEQVVLNPGSDDEDIDSDTVPAPVPAPAIEPVADHSPPTADPAPSPVASLR